ncbi:MAG: universal stress protein [Gammaproteobacteria bacterium]
MITYQHILFASDLSPESITIGKKARAIAQQHNATLSIAHVIDYAPLIYGGGEFATPINTTLEETLEKQAKASLRQQGEELEIPEDQQWTPMGNTKNEIVQLAQQIHADLIVIGAHDRHGFALLLGSTANAIIHTLPCDVLTIRVSENQ